MELRKHYIFRNAGGEEDEEPEGRASFHLWKSEARLKVVVRLPFEKEIAHRGKKWRDNSGQNDQERPLAR